MKFAEYDAPCGRLLLGVHGKGICLCDWMTDDRIERTLRRLNKFITPADGMDKEELFDETKYQLDRYFSGTLRQFDVPIKTFGTEFQRGVWGALQQIPYGETSTYKFIAVTVGLPRGARAVASAIGANPLSILIPCHRINGVDGSLTGYAGGIDAKRYLLRLES